LGGIGVAEGAKFKIIEICLNRQIFNLKATVKFAKIFKTIDKLIVESVALVKSSKYFTYRFIPVKFPLQTI
jgi:hypothetical protein